MAMLHATTHYSTELFGHFNILGGSIAQITKNALKSNILAVFRCTSTSDFSSPVRIFVPLPVILALPILGWISIAQFGQGSREKVSSVQPLRPSGTPHIANA
jgi:hypothetical protein